jgi:hypothetical protein
VPGVTINGLTPRADSNAEETARLLAALRAVAGGVSSTDAPGLVDRLPAAQRTRLAEVLDTATGVDSLGDERSGARHFIANPAIVRLRRYRAQTPAGSRYLTLQIAESGALLGVVVED